jgi:hypothetical protein
MEVFRIASQIYESELQVHAELEKHQPIIQSAAILHDMCDKKYMDETMGILEMKQYMRPYLGPRQIDVVGAIIASMSYSTVQKNGFPNLGEYQLAYHIVREADLLAAYSLERSVVYRMMTRNTPYDEAVAEAKALMHGRVLRYIDDGLFITKYAKEKAGELHRRLLDDVDQTHLL